jgi:hypothetical protein
MSEDLELAARLRAAQEKLGKWRGLYAGWWFGTKPIGNSQAKAARDNFDRTIMLRCEVNAWTAILLAKGVCTLDEFRAQLLEEVQHMDRTLEGLWPGFRTTEGSLDMKLPEAAETMRAKGFPP